MKDCAGKSPISVVRLRACVSAWHALRESSKCSSLLKIEANTFANPEQVFRLRPDIQLVDLEISYTANRYLCGLNTGGKWICFSSTCATRVALICVTTDWDGQCSSPRFNQCKKPLLRLTGPGGTRFSPWAIYPLHTSADLTYLDPPSNSNYNYAGPLRFEAAGVIDRLWENGDLVQFVATTVPKRVFSATCK